MANNIRQWLRGLELGQYADAFEVNAVDLDLLPELDETDLEKLGVAALGHRKKLLRAIGAMTDASTVPGPSNAVDRQREVAIPDHIAERITADADGRAGERKFVTVLFADIYQSTALTEDLDPEEARHLLDSAIDRMAAAVHRYDGIVNKVLGDGIMALFGAPLALEDHAARACYAAVSMQDAMRAAAAEARREFGAEVQARIGLHSGEVLVRAIKNDFSVDYDATGNAVSIASRMEQTALPGTIRLSHETWRLVENLINATSLGPIPIKGLSTPLDVYELRELNAAATHYSPTKRRQSPFTGRRQELSLLQQAWQSTMRSRGQALVFAGEAGVGKSRLFQEFLDTVSTEEGQVLRGGFHVHGEASPFQAMVSLLTDFLGIQTDESHDQLREKINVNLATISNATADLETPLLALFQVPVDNDEAWRLADPMQRRRRTLNAMIQFVSVLAARTPMALVFEDVQRADRDSLAFFTELIDALPVRPILLLLNHRSDVSLSWPELTQQRELAPLDTDRTSELLDKLLGANNGISDLKEMLLTRSGGNPLFLEEALGELEERGALSGVEGQRTLAAPIESVETPGTVQGIIAARIDRLQTHEKDLLQIVAVFGEEAPLSLLEQIAGSPSADVRTALAHLNSLGYLYEAELFPDIVYRFRNTFIQQVAYDGILKSRRRILHGRLAEEVESRYGARVGEVAEIVAYHFEKGGVRDVAIKYLMMASEKAEASYQYSVGVTFCRRAALLAMDQIELQKERCQALARQGDLLSLMGDWQRANEFYDQASEIADDDSLAREIKLLRHNFKTVEHEGLRLAYLSHGVGSEILLLTLPVVYNHALFQPLIPVFCHDYQIVTAQLLGQGETDPPRSGQTLRDSARDIAAIARRLDGNITGIGMSRASNILTHAALMYPDLFDRLILVSTPADDGVEGSRFPRPPQHVKEFKAAVAAQDWPLVAKLRASNSVPEPEAVDLRNLMETSGLNANRESLRRFYDPNPEMDITNLAANLPMPVLVMHGTADVQAPFEGSEFLAEQIPNGQLYAFEGKGHIPVRTATKEFCTALSNFLTSTR